jgi:hypothetical protein
MADPTTLSGAAKVLKGSCVVYSGCCFGRTALETSGSWFRGRPSSVSKRAECW